MDASSPDDRAEPRSTLDLWDYRRRVEDLYGLVREDADGERAWRRWRAERDELFSRHPRGALEPADRETFSGLPYFAYDPSWRLVAEVEAVEPRRLDARHSGAGETHVRAFGRVEAEAPTGPLKLTLFWLDVYGGGVFLPFRDATSGRETYGGGRYLLDTAKGADLGRRGDAVVLDFNFSYHPSCVHSDRWSCPLAPPENHLDVPVEAGERLADVDDPRS